ncbi:hypothetical protein BJV77DRAFT_961605 [Russula vinacea]|nr:hypothetical protein BJV77DRAFT_961605 [Russula vinacea]
MPPEETLRHSQPECPLIPPPTSGSNDQHTSPLDALLSPTTSSLPDTPSLPRDSVAESDLGEVRLNDDERFSTVSLNAAAARDSTVAVKSPVDESASSKPWAEDEPPPAPSEVPSASSMRASFLLQRLGNDVTSDQEGVSMGSRSCRKSLNRFGAQSCPRASRLPRVRFGNSDKLARAIEKGIPSNLRGWCGNLCLHRRTTNGGIVLEILKESSPHEKAITRDLGRRTGYRTGKLVQRPKGIFYVGYCQGLPFVVAILLLNMPDEEAFCLLVRLMYTYDLRAISYPKCPSCNCAFGFSHSFLPKNEAKLLSLKFDELVAFLNTGIIDTYKNFVEEGGKPTYRVDDFVNDAMSLRITPFMLDSYSHEYQEMIRVRDMHAAEMDALRNHNRQLSAQIQFGVAKPGACRYLMAVFRGLGMFVNRTNSFEPDYKTMSSKASLCVTSFYTRRQYIKQRMQCHRIACRVHPA